MHTNPDQELAQVAAGHHGIFTIEDATAAGLRSDQIKRRAARRWIQLHEGVYRMTGAPPTWRGDLLAATFAGGAGSAISHRSAAALYQLPGGRDDIVELTTRRWKRTTEPGLVVHESRRLDECDIHLVDCIPVVRPERLLLDLAALRPYADYVEAVIHAARRRRLITYPSARETFDRHARRGRKGVAVLRTVLDQWNPDSRVTESEMETLLLQELRDHGLPEPRLQHEVFDAQGELVARVDAAYPSFLIAIEYDSMQEHSDEFQLERDARRRNALQTLGYVVLSVRHTQLTSRGGELCAQIGAIMRRTRAEPA